MKTALQLIGICSIIASASVYAQNGIWTNHDDSAWGVSTNWLNGIVADGSGNTADFSTTDQTSTRTVILDASHSISALSFADTDTNTPASWILTTNIPGGQVLTLAGASPTITVGNLAPGNYVELRNTNAGTAGFTKAGIGELRLTGVNGITGQIYVDGGRLYLAGGTFAGGTLPLAVTNNLRNGATLSVGNTVTNVFVPSGYTGNLEMRGGITGTGIGGDSGSVLNLNSTVAGATMTAGGSWAHGGSISNINVTTSASGTVDFFRLRSNGGSFDGNSFQNTVVNLDRINLYLSTYSTGADCRFGNLNGTTNAIISGGAVGSRARFIVGQLNMDGFWEGSMTTGNGMTLQKEGTGTLTLSGTNILYQPTSNSLQTRRGGETIINGGTLALTNGASIKGGIVSGGVEYFAYVTVNTNGTYDVGGTTNNTTSPLTILNGYGLIKGNYVHDEGILSPGAALAAGTLTFLNDLTITNNPTTNADGTFYALVTSNSVIQFDISPSLTSGNDLINVGGKVYVDGNPNVQVNFLGGASAGAYTLIHSTNGVVGNPSGWNVQWGGRGTPPTVTATANDVLLNVSLGNSANLVWQGYSNAVWDVNTTSNWLNGASVDKYYQLDSVTFNESSPLQTAVTLNTIVTPASITVSNGTTAYSISGSGQIGGGASLVKRGAGTFTLTTANTFSGGTLITENGMLDISSTATALGSGSVTLSNGVFQFSHGSATTINNPIILSAGSTNTIHANGGNVTTLAGGLSGGGGGQLTLSSDASPKSLDLSGDDSSLSGTVTMTSNFNVRMRSAAAGNMAGAYLNLAGGTTLSTRIDNTPATNYLGALSGDSSEILDGYASSGGGAGANITWEIGALGLDTTFAGVIKNGNQSSGTNNTSLTKVGSGKLTLTGANTYTGNTVINNGTLSISIPYLAKLSSVVIAAPGKLELNFNGTNFVNRLVLDGVQQPYGSYGATGSGAATIDDVHFAGTGVLSVGVSSTSLGTSLSGNQLTLAWPSDQPWRLQAQTNSLNSGIGTNWVDVSGVVSPYTVTVDATNSTVFYRLIYP